MRLSVPLAALALGLLALAALAGCGARQGEICFAPDGPQAEARDCGAGLSCDVHTDASGTTVGRCAPRETLHDSSHPDGCGSDPQSGKPLPCDDPP